MVNGGSRIVAVMIIGSLVGLGGCGRDHGRAPARMEEALQERVVGPLAEANIPNTVRSRVALQNCSAGGVPSDSSWNLDVELDLGAPVDRVAEVLADHVLVVEREAYVRLQQNSSEPIGWEGEIMPAAVAGRSTLHLMTPVDVDHDEPTRRWDRTCSTLSYGSRERPG